MEEPTTFTDIPTDTFGRYRVLAGLGRGGMAAVHLAVIEGPSGFNKLVVLKQILPEFADDGEILEMFLDEARLAARLSHPNVVQTNEVGCEGNTHFLAMEYLDGQPLNRIVQRLARHGGFPLAMHLQVIADLLAGLHYAHELADYDGSSLGVVHCDVSPANTFVTYDGVVKVVDFGVAKARTALTQTRLGVVKGKLAYMSPEQMRGDELDRRADIFAVGVMLWEAATGTRPWKGVSEMTMVKCVLAGQFPAPCSSNRAVPVELESIILKALSFDRESRYATAAALQSAIDGYLQTLGGRLAQREVGELIAAQFAAERGVVTSLIEEQLQADIGPPDGARRRAPLLALARPEGDTSKRARSVGPLRARPPERAARPREPGGSAAVAHRTIVTLAPGGEHGPGGENPPSNSGTGAPVVVTTVVRTLRPRPLLVAALAVLLGALGATALRASPARTASLEPVAGPGSETRAAPGASASSTVELRLSASPAEARFFIDDAPLEGNPFQGELPRDHAVHRVRIAAPGFLPRVESVTLDQNTILDVELAAEPAHARSQPAHARPQPSASSSAGVPKAPRIVEW